MFENIKQFITEKSGKKYSFITGNGTSAIYLALKAIGLEKGSKIAVPNIACPDPVYALIWAGYKPVFIDVNIDDYNMNIDKLDIELKNDNNIKAIIVIHLFGNACDIINIKKLAEKYNCFLIEDCAQALGNEIEEGKLGSFGDVSIFSFGNGKIIEVGHGGAINTNDKELLKKVKSEYKKLPKYNESEINRLSKLHRKIYYKLYYLGIKYPKLNILNLIFVYFFKNYYLYKLDDTKTKKILKKIDTFESNRKERIKIVDYYLNKLDGLVIFPKLNNKENILSRLTVIIDDSESISKKIRDNGIPSNIMYPMLVDRFVLFFDKLNYGNSYKLKGSFLNLWTNNVNKNQIDKTINILQEYNNK
jgi:dTDP-4-amino-4,6-dideoxygalactose transaminase